MVEILRLFRREQREQLPPVLQEVERQRSAMRGAVLDTYRSTTTVSDFLAKSSDALRSFAPEFWNGPIQETLPLTADNSVQVLRGNTLIQDMMRRHGITEEQMLRVSAGNHMMLLIETALTYKYQIITLGETLVEHKTPSGETLHMLQYDIARLQEKSIQLEKLRDLNGVPFYIDTEADRQRADAMLSLAEAADILPDASRLPAGIITSNKSDIGSLYNLASRIITLRQHREDRKYPQSALMRDFSTYAHEERHARQEETFSIIKELDAFTVQAVALQAVVDGVRDGKIQDRDRGLSRQFRKGKKRVLQFMNGYYKSIKNPAPARALFADHNIYQWAEYLNADVSSKEGAGGIILQRIR